MANDPTTEPSTLRTVMRYAPTVLLTAAAVLFIAQNREDAALSMLWTTITAPLWLVLSAVFAVGFLAGFLVVRRRTRAARG